MQIFSKIKSKIVFRIIILLCVGLTLGNLLYLYKNTDLFKNRSSQLLILYDQNFDGVQKLAKKKNKVFAVVLARPECPPCEVYIQHLDSTFKHLSSKVIFNVVNVTLPENEWYLQWLCTGHSPITCIFSPDGELKTVIKGVKMSALQRIDSAISGHTECAENFHPKYFSATGDYMQTFNALLAFKQDLNKGKDLSPAIDAWLNQTNHPYFIYLKCINEQKQGRHENAVSLAKRFLTAVHDNELYFHIYNNLLDEIKTIIDPNYTPPVNDGILSVVEELYLGDKKFMSLTPFSLTLTNTGTSPLSVHRIGLSCSCVKPASEGRFTLSPGQSQKVDFVFTADVEGEVFREITFHSNATNPMQRVSIFATVNKKK
jgi:hypothetical protein